METLNEMNSEEYMQFLKFQEWQKSQGKSEAIKSSPDIVPDVIKALPVQEVVEEPATEDDTNTEATDILPMELQKLSVILPDDLCMKVRRQIVIYDFKRKDLADQIGMAQSTINGIIAERSELRKRTIGYNVFVVMSFLELEDEAMNFLKEEFKNQHKKSFDAYMKENYSPHLEKKVTEVVTAASRINDVVERHKEQKNANGYKDSNLVVGQQASSSAVDSKRYLSIDADLFKHNRWVKYPSHIFKLSPDLCSIVQKELCKLRATNEHLRVQGEPLRKYHVHPNLDWFHIVLEETNIRRTRVVNDSIDVSNESAWCLKLRGSGEYSDENSLSDFLDGKINLPLNAIRFLFDYINKPELLGSLMKDEEIRIHF